MAPPDSPPRTPGQDFLHEHDAEFFFLLPAHSLYLGPSFVLI